jgi:hypothetical protein
MGLSGYYRRFILGFSKISHPITSLQKKGTKFEWTPKCEENFTLLKELLTSAPMLKIPNPNESFVVCTDACKKDLGDSSRKMDMSLVMSLESLSNVRETMPHITWNLLSLSTP